MDIMSESASSLPRFLAPGRRQAKCLLLFYAAFFVSFLVPCAALAAAEAKRAPFPAESPILKKCLKRADELPDIAAFEAQVWIRKNGGNDARLCRAFAQANRGMHIDAAREFWALASAYEKQTPKDEGHALLMRTFAGQEFLAAKDVPNAEAQFAAALKIAPEYPAALLGLAQTRMQAERYWEALDYLNRILKRNPGDIAALRQRGLVWMNLSDSHNAQEDFIKANILAEGKAEN